MKGDFFQYLLFTYNPIHCFLCNTRGGGGSAAEEK